MSKKLNGFRFDDFWVDVIARQLIRDGKAVPMTPRSFDLLTVLIENSPEIVTKQDLTDRVWNASFVEDGSIRFLINQLRKALSDDPGSVRYIETVRGRGYRFISPFESIYLPQKTEIREKNEVEEVMETKDMPFARGDTDPDGRLFRMGRILLFAAAAGLFGVFAAYLLWTRNADASSRVPVLNGSFAASKLTTDGESLHSAISRDGSFIVYASGVYTTKQSIWLRDISTNVNRVILPADDYSYLGLKLSPDDKTLYFVRRDAASGGNCLMTIPIVGGIPENIYCGKEVQGWFDISTAGDHISFVQCARTDDYRCTLKIIDVNGRNGRDIYSTKPGIRIGPNGFSPDGGSIAFASGQSNDASDDFALYRADVANGTVREITGERFFNIYGIEWPADGKDILMTAKKSNESNAYFCLVNIADGAVSAFRNTVDDFVGFSSTRDLRRIVADINSSDFRTFIYSGDNFRQKIEVGNANWITFMPNGRLLIESEATNKKDIWSMNPDGTDKKQLTSDPAGANFPIADSKRIYFTSNRTGQMQVWSMAFDGSSLKQMTKEIGGQPVGFSGDGKWVYYRAPLVLGKLWRVSTEDGREEATPVTERQGRISFSPDGSSVVRFEKNAVVMDSVTTGENIKRIELPESAVGRGRPVWSGSGKNIYMVLGENNSNQEVRGQCSVWRQPAAGGRAVRLFDLPNCPGEREGLAISPDEKNIGVLLGRFQRNIVLIDGLK